MKEVKIRLYINLDIALYITTSLYQQAKNKIYLNLSPSDLFKGTVMHTEKPLVNDRHVFEVYLKIFAFQLLIIL